MGAGDDIGSTEERSFNDQSFELGPDELKRLRMEAARLKSELEATRAKAAFLERQTESFNEIVEAAANYASTIKEEAEKQAALILEAAQQENERLSRERESVWRDKEQLSLEKQALSREKERLCVEKEEVSRDLEEIGREKEELWREITSLVAEREEARRELAETLRQLTNVKQQQIYLNQAREQLAADLDALGERLRAIRSAIEETIEPSGPRPQGGAQGGVQGGAIGVAGGGPHPSAALPAEAESETAAEPAVPEEAPSVWEPARTEPATSPPSVSGDVVARPEAAPPQTDLGRERAEQPRVERRRFATWLTFLVDSPLVTAAGYLIALTAAELLTITGQPWTGLTAHGILLVALLLHAAMTGDKANRNFLLCLAFAPLIRLLSLSLFLFWFPLIYWYFVISIPLITTAFLTARLMGWSLDSIGLNFRALPLQAVVALSGLAFGFIEYEILQPKPLIDSLTWEAFIIPAVVLFICTGFTEELIFRGMMQRAAITAMGTIAGLLLVATVFAMLHLGNKSTVDVVFVFAVGLFFGWVVLKTRSIVGATTAHGITNIVLMLVAPLIPLASLLTQLDLLPFPLPFSSPLVGAVTSMTDGPAPSLTNQQGAASLTSPIEPVSNPTPANPQIDLRLLSDAADPTPTAGPTAIPVSVDGPSPDAAPEEDAALEEAAPSAEVPPSDLVPATPSPSAAPPVAVIVAPSTNIRSGAGWGFSSVLFVYSGQEYEIIGRNPAGNWLLVRYGTGAEGWISFGSVTTQGDMTGLPVLQSASRR